MLSANLRKVERKTKKLVSFFCRDKVISPSMMAKILKTSEMQKENMFFFSFSFSIGFSLSSFSFCHQKENRSKRKSAKTSWLGGRLSDFSNHSMRSALPLATNGTQELATLGQHLMSISLSCYASQESKTIPKIGHPLKTSSCGMFSSAAHRMSPISMRQPINNQARPLMV